jgi:hypothetical protein
MAGHEASLPHSAVDTVIPMTRGLDKLRTVCGRLRGNAARERFCNSSDSRRFRRWEAPAATRPTVVAPAQGPADPIPGNVARRCFGIPTAARAAVGLRLGLHSNAAGREIERRATLQRPTSMRYMQTVTVAEIYLYLGRLRLSGNGRPPVTERAGALQFGSRLDMLGGCPPS